MRQEMLRLSLLITSILIIGGCSSTQYNYTSPYCYTDETVVMNNDTTVSSETVLQCTDRPGQQTAIQRAGIDAGCEEFWYSEKRNGSIIRQRGVICEKFDGSFEIVNINGNNR